jgi:2-(1,2-epoxy-1,2-dihydrophenyl)acetyl-CoA isomerase
VSADGYRSRDGLAVELGAGGVLRCVLDRPAKRNALDDEMVAGLIEAIDLAGRDEAVRAIVIAGAGDHFCGGFDIVSRNAGGSGAGSERRPRAGSIQRRLPSQAHALVPLLLSVQVPVVAVVRGWAAGIGLHLVLAADFAVVADDARLWEPFSERGFTPDSGGTWLLPRRIGEVRAREMLLLGRAVTGREAASWGMVHRAVPPTELDTEVEQLVTALAGGATVALGLSKWLMHAGAAAKLEDQLRNEAFAMELSSRSEDFREGLTAFKDKRPPQFGGR